MALEKIKESKEKYHNQQAQEERDVAYAQMVQNLEKTRAMVRNSVSRASTISAEECQLTLTEDDFWLYKGKWTKLIRDWMSYVRIGMQNIEMLYLQRIVKKKKVLQILSVKI